MFVQKPISTELAELRKKLRESKDEKESLEIVAAYNAELIEIAKFNAIEDGEDPNMIRMELLKHPE